MTESPETETPQVEFGENYKTSQIYRRGFEFAFMAPVDGVYKQACTFVFCKDFLHDVVWAVINKTKWSIWGFKYDSAVDAPLSLENCIFAFRNTLEQNEPQNFHGRLEACREFLHGFEAQLGFEPSRFYPVEHEEGPCWLIIGDKGWQHAPPMVGLYTLLIRLGPAHTLGEDFSVTLQKAKEGQITIGDNSEYAGSKDASYIAQAWDGIQVILKHGLKVFHDEQAENYPEDIQKRGKGLHDNYGPVSFAKRIPSQAMPHWYRKEVWSE